VTHDNQAKPYTVRYEAVNAMLLNEFLKEHRKVANQGSEIAEVKTTVAELKSALKEQAAQIRRVGAQVATSKASPQVVSANRRRRSFPMAIRVTPLSSSALTKMRLPSRLLRAIPQL